ncbi:MAG: GerW family sporulation protein [Thermaerobacterales bacterium]
MEGHPIQGLMKTAMESIKDMVDVNTVVGDAVEAKDGTVIVPVSRVSFGFAAGGGEYETQQMQSNGHALPFAGGSGAGVTVQPVGFLVVGHGGVRLLPVSEGAIYDRLIDLAPEVLNRLSSMMGRKGMAADEDQELIAPSAPTSSDDQGEPAAPGRDPYSRRYTDPNN